MVSLWSGGSRAVGHAIGGRAGVKGARGQAGRGTAGGKAARACFPVRRTGPAGAPAGPGPDAHVDATRRGPEHRVTPDLPALHEPLTGGDDVAVGEQEPPPGADHHEPAARHRPVEGDGAGVPGTHRRAGRHGHGDSPVAGTPLALRHHERLHDRPGQGDGHGQRDARGHQRCDEEGQRHATMCLTPCRQRQVARAAAARPSCGSG